MKSVIILAIITLSTFLGDYCIKVTSQKADGMRSLMFVSGTLLYGLPAVGWFYLMQQHTLSVVGVFYSSMTICLLAGMGYFMFEEPFGMREALGISLAIASIIVMNH